MLYRENGPVGKELYRVRSGKLRVFTGSEELGWLYPGDLAGEALLYTSSSPVSVQATETSTLRVIPAHALKASLGALPAWMLALAKHLCASLKRSETQAQEPLTDDVPHALATFLGHACHRDFQEAHALLDRFCWMTHLPFSPVQDTLRLFSLFQWVRTSGEGESLQLRLEHKERLEAFAFYRRCMLENADFPPFLLEKSQCKALPLLRTAGMMTEMAWLSFLQGAIPSLELSHFLHFKELGLLVPAGEGRLSACKDLAALYEAALESRLQIEAVG